MRRTDPGARGLLIAFEGLDGPARTLQLELLSTWLERRGTPARVIPWQQSPLVARAAAEAPTRTSMSPRVAALLGAADMVALGHAIEQAREAGEIVLADRYAWSGAAREVARGLEPAWVETVFATLPVPDLVLLFREPAADALRRALESHPDRALTAAVSEPFRQFLEAVTTALEAIAAEAVAGTSLVRSPFRPGAVCVLDAAASPEDVASTVRQAVKPYLGSAAAEAAKPVESKPVESKPVESKPSAAKPSPSKAVAAKGKGR